MYEDAKHNNDDLSFKEEQQSMVSVGSDSFAGRTTLCSTKQDDGSTHFIPDNDAKQSRNFFFTVHKYNSLREFFDELKVGCLYARAQEERGGRAGKLHVQACVGYRTQRRLRTVRDRFPDAYV